MKSSFVDITEAVVNDSVRRWMSGCCDGWVGGWLTLLFHI